MRAKTIHRVLFFTLTIVFLSLFFPVSQQSFSRVKPPHDFFNLEQLTPFFPQNSIEAIQKKWGRGVLVKQSELTQTLRFELSHLRYQFPVMVQIHRNSQIVLDFYISLPSYFLHNSFHQSLINRYGKQDHSILLDRHAHYQWKNHSGLKHAYGAACTITCFPLYYSVALAHPPIELEGYQTILDTLHHQEKKLRDGSFPTRP